MERRLFQQQSARNEGPYLSYYKELKSNCNWCKSSNKPPRPNMPPRQNKSPLRKIIFANKLPGAYPRIYGKAIVFHLQIAGSHRYPAGTYDMYTDFYGTSHNATLMEAWKIHNVSIDLICSRFAAVHMKNRWWIWPSGGLGNVQATKRSQKQNPSARGWVYSISWCLEKLVTYMGLKSRIPYLPLWTPHFRPDFYKERSPVMKAAWKVHIMNHIINRHIKNLFIVGKRN